MLSAMGVATGGMDNGTGSIPMDDQVASIMRTAENGMGNSEPFEFTVSEHASDTFVSYTYLLGPWMDEANARIASGMAIFVSSYIDDSYGTCFATSIAHLNNQMAMAYQRFQIESTPDTGEATADAIRFRTLLERFGDDPIDQYATAIANGAIKPGNGSDDMTEFMDMAQKPEFQLLTRYGISHNWRFAGFALSQPEYGREGCFDNDEPLSLAVAVAKKATVTNVWGSANSCHAGSKAYFLLRRKRVAGGYGPFEIFPYVTSVRTSVPMGEISYVDYSGKITRGRIFGAGTVLQESMFEAPANRIHMATGLSPQINMEAAYEAHGTLPSCVLNVGM
jgi:hypothetical protein